MPVLIIRDDITRVAADAVVNAANTELRMGGGVCGAIFEAAGRDEMKAACAPLAPIAVGDAVLTPGFALPAKYVIHAAGPVFREADAARCELELRSAYTRSLELAVRFRCESIAFPLISSGIYGYPKREALRVATESIWDFLGDPSRRAIEMLVYIVVYDKASFEIGAELAGRVESYIDEHYIAARPDQRAPGSTAFRSVLPDRKSRDAKAKAETEERDLSRLPGAGVCAELIVEAEKTAAASESEWAEDLRPAEGIGSTENLELSEDFGSEQAAEWTDRSLSRRLDSLDESFSRRLLRMIDLKGRSDVEVYKRANLDRKLFSKIRSNPDYHPGRRTVLALAVALELSREETESLLRCAGYAFSPSSKLDVIVEYFIVNKHYDVLAINEMLFHYDQPLLGG